MSVPGIPIPQKMPRWGALLAWVGGAWVTVGERVVSNGGIYQVIVEGLTAAPGDSIPAGPSGTSNYTEPVAGSGVGATNAAVWQYIGPATTTWVTGSVLAVGTQRVGVAAPNTYLVIGQGGGNSTIDPGTLGSGAGPLVAADGYTWLFMAQATAVDTEPSEGQKDVGWLPGQQPPAQFMNWQGWRVYRTLLWIWSNLKAILSFPFASGVRRIAAVPDFTTLLAIPPAAALYQVGIAYAQYAYVSDPYGNTWYASAAHVSGGVTWPANAYPGATVNDVTAGLTWTCAALAGVTPAAPLYDPTVTYTLHAVVSDPNGLIWYLTTAAAAPGGTAPTWPTAALIIGTQTAADVGGNHWTMAGLGQNGFVNDGDVFLSPSLGMFKFIASSSLPLIPNCVATPTFPHPGSQQWVKVDRLARFSQIVVFPNTGNNFAIQANGSGTSPAILATGGLAAGGDGIQSTAGGGSNGSGVYATGDGSGPGVKARGGASGVGVDASANATAVYARCTGTDAAVNAASNSGPGIITAGNSTSSPINLVPVTTVNKPAVPSEGDLYYDFTLHKLRVYTGAAWETITSV